MQSSATNFQRTCIKKRIHISCVRALLLHNISSRFTLSVSDDSAFLSPIFFKLIDLSVIIKIIWINPFRKGHYWAKTETAANKQHQIRSVLVLWGIRSHSWASLVPLCSFPSFEIRYCGIIKTAVVPSTEGPSQVHNTRPINPKRR